MAAISARFGTGIAADMTTEFRRVSPELADVTCSARHAVPRARCGPRPQYGTLRVMATYHNFIDGFWVPSVSGEVFENRNPADRRELIGLFQKSDKRDAMAAIDAARRAYAHWRLVPAPRRAEILFRAAQPAREPQGSTRPRHDARDGQGPRRNARRRAGSDRHDVLHGRRGPAALRTDRALRAARQVRDVGSSAARRVGRDHALEFSDGDPVVEDHSGARLRQHRRLQAGDADAALGRELRQDARGGRASRAASSTS